MARGPPARWMRVIGNQPELQAYHALRGLLRPVVPPADRDRVATQVQRLSADQRSWLLQRTAQERGAGWLLEHRRQGLFQLEGPELAALQRAAATELRRTLEADALRRQLLPLLSGPVPQLLLLKGAATEQRVYPPGVMRHCIEVDALAIPGQLAAVLEALRDLGLRCIHRDASGRTEHYAHPAGGATLDLHLRLACPWRFPRYGTAQQLEAAAARLTLLADGSRVLCPSDATLQLLVHLTAGLGGDLRHLADAAQWLLVLPPDPNALASAAKELGLARAVAASCGWLADLEPAITQPLLQALGPRPLADTILDNLQHQQVVAHYLRHGPALAAPLNALSELLTVDFPRGALGLTAVTLASRWHRSR